MSETITTQSISGTLTAGDTITFEGHKKWHWLVRIAARLTQNELPPRKMPPRQFIVTATCTSSDYGIAP